MPSAQTTYPSTTTAYPVPPAVAGAGLASALAVSPSDAVVNLEGLAVVYPPITSSGGTVA